MKSFTRCVRDSFEVLLMMQAIVDHGGTVVSVVADGRLPQMPSFMRHDPVGGYREVYALVPSEDAMHAIDDAYEKARGGK